ncbi:50S ribosomal protein L13 [Candidatus Bathyarchaeota archaeon]|nr:50S ribosomal protein L13 [Candidatus Bathyarchaeota archaeon]MBS7618289.1 50S ribosomal protein L13 [Candidatus Bathyarchaeota archaeon]
MSSDEITVIDGSNHVMGRLASIVAKRLLQGEKIAVVNAENVVVSGNFYSVLREWNEFLEVGKYGKGPFHSRRPDTILRHVVRGMLPRDKFKGRNAFRRLKVYISVPEAFKNVKFEVVEEAKADKLKGPYFRLGELASRIGWRVK